MRNKDLTSFAWQISDALCYLALNKFVHKDVSARNVLITKSLISKLGDFGLCHSLDPEHPQHETPKGKLPIRWTAPEALRDGIFSEKSDVWSFGVLLYEMYSGAATPYPNIEAEDLLQALEQGERLHIPSDAPENM